MRTYNVHAAKTHLSDLVQRAVAGEEIVIAKAGKPQVKLVPINGTLIPRVPGGLKGKLRIMKGFYDPLLPEEFPGFKTWR